MRAWHFVGEKLRDGRPIPADGEWLVHEGDCVMCDRGLHFSLDPFDALQYAPGPLLCEVEVEDIVAEDTDKGVCRRRMIVQRKDITALLRCFARKQALSVIHLWDAPEVVREYLETGNEELRDAARAASGDASFYAAYSAAYSAANAAYAAEYAADMNARKMFSEMVNAEFGRV